MSKGALEKWSVMERRSFLKLMGMTAAAVAVAPHVLAETLQPQQLPMVRGEIGSLYGCRVVTSREVTLRKFVAVYKLGPEQGWKNNIPPTSVIDLAHESLMRDMARALWTSRCVPVAQSDFGNERTWNPWMQLYARRCVEVIIKPLGSAGTVDPADIYATVAIWCYAYEDRLHYARLLHKEVNDISTLIPRGVALSVAASRVKAGLYEALQNNAAPMSTYIGPEIPRNFGKTIRIHTTWSANEGKASWQDNGAHAR